MEVKEMDSLLQDAFNGDTEAQDKIRAQFINLNSFLGEAVPVLTRMAGNDYSRGMEGNYPGILGEARTQINNIQDRITRVVAILVDISDGDLSKIDAYRKIEKRSDADIIVPAFHRTFDALEALSLDAHMLARAGAEGKLDARADLTRHHGEYRKIIEGMNTTLDAVIGPLNMAAEYIDRISKGEIPQKVTDKYNGDFNEIKNNLNACIDGLQGLVESNAVLARMAVNDHSKGVEGNYQGIYAETKTSVNLVRDRVNRITDIIVRISDGDLSDGAELRKVGKRSEADKVVPSFIRTFNALEGLTNDANMLAKAATEGKLDTRADVKKHQGEYRKIIEGMNATQDAVIGPLNMAAEYIDRISKGEIPQKITDKYNGDFNEIKNTLNACIDGLQGLVESNAVLARMAVNDHSKGVEGNYQGIYAETKTSVNLVRDRVNHITDIIVRISNGDLSDGENLRKVGKRSEADKVVPSFIRTFDALEGLTNDANMLTKAAVDGTLKVRADAQKHHGEYKKIVEGMNATLDAVVAPLREAMQMANEFAKCNFSARFDENLHMEGDFIRFKDALNNTGIEVSKAVNLINQQFTELASSAEEANASIEEISSGAEQIAKNAAGVSTNAEHGNEGITQVLRAMEDLNQTVTDVAQKAERVSQLTEDANTLSEKGTGLAEQAERGMQSITTSSNEVDKIIVDIKAEMDKIGKIVGLISDLANQTNLLALNAAIEAARAGEAGRGFAVVATEVKSLAQESRASAENIADMIGTLQKKSVAAGEAVASSNREVKAGSEALSHTLRAFKDIAKSIEDISKNVVEVASVSEEQAATVEEVTASVNEVHNMVQATAKDAMDSAAASEEASASIDQIAKVMGNVNVIVDNVSKEMGKFKV
jgi:methyl-accepting chemotaxis protein